MANNKLAYLELSTPDVKLLKDFYGPLCGWTFQDFGEDYAAFVEAGLDGGFIAAPQQKTRAPLAIIQTSAIESIEEQIRQAGGSMTMPTFSGPGGRRFHFTDPAGNEMAIMQVDEATT